MPGPATPNERRTLLSRRDLLVAASAWAAAPLVRAGDPAAASAGSGRPSAHDRPGIGVIGCRYQGSVIAAQAKAHGRIVALADVDGRVRDLAAIDPNVQSQVGMTPAEIYADVAASDRHVDYRRLLDDERIGVVLIGSPDHWHAKMLIDAVQAGKDVYCEKPLTLTIDEGKQIRKAVAASRRIVQVGSWQRSDHRFRTAAEMVRQGRIGRLRKVEVVLGKNEVGGPFHAVTSSPFLDPSGMLGF
jgi:predicted dehydrogenase